MDPGTVSRQLLDYVRKSRLNFQINESPFSVNISVRKTFIKDRSGCDQFPLQPDFAAIHGPDQPENNIKIVDEK